MGETWRPIGTCEESRALVLFRSNDRYWVGSGDSPGAATHWAPLPEMPEPDPMTVVAWHPMEKLPDNDEDSWVILRFDDKPWNQIVKTGNVLRLNSMEFCPLAPLLDIIDEATDG